MYAFWLVLTYDLLDQNVVRTSVTHSAAPRVPLFCSYPILTSSVICYWTDARQFGIYLLNIYIYIYIYIYINSAVNISQYVCNGREAIQSLNRLCDVNPRFLLFHFMQIVYFQFLIVNSNYIEHQKLIAELAERSPITIQNSSNPSSRKNLVVRPYKVLLLACAANCITGTILAIT